MANRKAPGPDGQVGQLLAALKMCRAAEGEEVMWAQVPAGLQFLSELLEEIEGLGPEYALEVALKTALEVGG
ncbi:MAG TPA: hypothetical protein VM537_23880 [Anaerolineae bacterium]|nr:hypothetical protein [Anaerolineae bacterium]